MTAPTPTPEHERYNQVRYQRPETARQADLPEGPEGEGEASGEDIEHVDVAEPVSGEPHWADEPPTPVVLVEEAEKPRITYATTNTYTVDATNPVKVVQQRRVVRDIHLRSDGPAELRMLGTAGNQSSYVLDSGDGKFTTHTTMTVWAVAQTDTVNLSVWEEWTDDVD
jgi:hypothetical protein